jgi:hypothetical protein
MNELDRLYTDVNRVVEKLALKPNKIEAYPWDNVVYVGPEFRWAHVENYKHPKAQVIHTVIMPKDNDELGIFGLDVIAINDKITGLFLDVTPSEDKLTDLIFGEDRPVPDWCEFSPNFICVKPDLSKLCLVLDVLKDYLSRLGKNIGKDQKNIRQNYINMQRRNPQTRKMLEAHIGKELAKKFIEEVLFPDVY